MKALALVLALSLSGVARAADDAPTVATGAQALCLTPVEQTTLAQRLAADKARIASLEADAGKVQPLPIVITALVALAAGVGLGFGISAATRR